jgi:hypothetical protein
MVARKDQIIEKLERNLEEIEDQYQLALRSHLENLDALIDLFDAKVQQYEEALKQELDEMNSIWNQEAAELNSKFEKEKEYILDVIAAMEQEFMEAENAAKQELQVLRDEIKNKNAQEFAPIRGKLEARIEQLEKLFDQV